MLVLIIILVVTMYLFLTREKRRQKRIAKAEAEANLTWADVDWSKLQSQTPKYDTEWDPNYDPDNEYGGLLDGGRYPNRTNTGAGRRYRDDDDGDRRRYR